MKPEVTKIFDDLEAWLDHCRFNLLKYDPADLYKSHEWREFAGKTNEKPVRPKRKKLPARKEG